MAAMPGVMKLDGWDDAHSANSDYDPYSVRHEPSPRRRERDMRGSRSPYSNGYDAEHHGEFGDEDGPTYFLEHLATFSVGHQFALETPKDGLRKLFQMEKSKGIWTQKMKMRLDRKWVIIIDCENGDVVERFPMSLISEPTAFTSDDPRELYNNILVFVVRDDAPQQHGSHAEMHIFQCVRVSAQEVVDDIKAFMVGKWKARGSRGSSPHALPPPPSVAAPVPPVNGINVREQVSIFNAVSASSPGPDSQVPPSPPSVRQVHDRTDAVRASAAAAAYSRDSNDETSSTSSEKYERDVAVLNHCFDDIERFIARLQHAAAAYRELERRRKSRKNKKKDLGDGMLSMRAKPPPEREFVDILQKFKLSFNLLAKLRNHIHEPNSPELVHFLFTPLAVIVDAARDCRQGALPSRVVNPRLTREAVDLLTNCCTSKENELWRSLGNAWVVPREPGKSYEDEPFRPVFSDGWAPDFGPEDGAEPPVQALRGRRPQEAEVRDVADYHHHRTAASHLEAEARFGGGDYGSERPSSLQVSPYDRSFSPRDHLERPGTRTPSEQDVRETRSDLSTDSMEQADPRGREQRVWAQELRSQGVKVVQVVYPRTANNDKELTVVRGEYLEILDDSRKWWKTRNIRGQVGHVPHTIVTPLQDDGSSYDQGSTRDNYSPSESPTGAEPPGDGLGPSNYGAGPRGPRQPPAPADWVRRERQGKKDYENKGSPEPPSHDPPAPAPPVPQTVITEPIQRGTARRDALECRTNTSAEPTSFASGPEGAPKPKDAPSAPKGTSGSSSKEPKGRSFEDELKLRVSLGPKADKKWGKVRASAIHQAYITGESTPDEVWAWLTAKDFGDRVKSLCEGLSGAHMFALTKEKLEIALPVTDAARLASHLTVQKNLCNYKPPQKDQLSEILQARRSQIDADGCSADAQSHARSPPVPPKPVRGGVSPSAATLPPGT